MDEMKLPPDKCPYCKGHLNKAAATEDHIIPKSHPHCGAKTDYRNLIWACGTCNNVIKKNRVFINKTMVTNIGTSKHPKNIIENAKARRHYINGVSGVIALERRKDDPVD